MSCSVSSQTSVTWFFGWMIAGTVWAGPAHSAPPLVEPRASKPDSVRAWERARADSLQATRDHLSGTQSLAIGLAATLGPPLVAYLANPRDPDNPDDTGWQASLTLGSLIGVYAGPAIGLAAGGRSDLAGRGLAFRSVGYLCMLAGVAGVASSFDSNGGGGGSYAVAIVGLGGAGLSTFSAIYDLSITPSAVGPRPKKFSVQPVVDPRGRFALQATF